MDSKLKASFEDLAQRMKINYKLKAELERLEREGERLKRESERLEIKAKWSRIGRDLLIFLAGGK